MSDEELELEVPKRKVGRPRTKVHVPILTPEQVLGLQRPDQIRSAEERAKDAERKRAERARAKIRAETAKSESIEAFWQESRKSLDPDKLVEYQARHDYVEALLGDIRTVLENQQPDTEFIADVENEIREDIAQFGVAHVTVPLLIGEFWKNPEQLARLTNGDTPSAIFAKFGLLIAIDDFTFFTKWTPFLSRLHKKPQQELAPLYVSLSCTKCKSLPTSVCSDIAAAYVRSGNYVCQRCLDASQKARTFSKEHRLPENQIRDQWGRVRDE